MAAPILPSLPCGDTNPAHRNFPPRLDRDSDRICRKIRTRKHKGEEARQRRNGHNSPMSWETVENPKKPKESSESEAAPMVGQTYWVRCGGYRTRATYTSSGKWLEPHNGKEVDRVTGFFE